MVFAPGKGAQREGRAELLRWGGVMGGPELPAGSAGEKPGTEQDEVKLQNASKQIVQTAILRAVQQVSQESQQKEKLTNSTTNIQLERGKLMKKHEKK
ncbi:PREDICTED: putative uncharacterized protein C18orf42 homolog [Acanthisitta chloris]|uniref:putative uncharacterized protein C18orf42 homolog n=1 Tax=Acanthisitta chloris TaxID=57068 RepID=UPI0004F0CF2F|nr:PREDICTED: putative uncharacterized protein C18orf42 homolog [Acanthisitta chloris]